MKKRLVIILMLFVTIVIFSCTKSSDPETTGNINGIVKNAETNYLISGVNVSIPDIASTVTNSQGQYSFEKLDPQTYDLYFIKDGYQDNNKSVTVKVGETVNGDVLLTPIVPDLEVSVPALDFGETLTSLSFTITNTGNGSLNWSITEQIPWLVINPTSGTVTNQSSSVAALVDRSGLNPGNYLESITIVSNGGNATILISMQVQGPVLEVNTNNLNFGTQSTTEIFVISNSGYGDLNWSIVPDENWVTVFPSSGTISTGTSAVTVTVDRDGLPDGNHYATLTITSNANSVNLEILVTVPSPDEPFLTVFPYSLDFGSSETEIIVTIQNTGTGTLNWNVADDRPWITCSPINGTTNTEIDEVSVVVDRSGMSDDTYTGSINITSNGGNENISVSMEVLDVQILSVNPTSLDFGSYEDSLTFEISNEGSGDLEWETAVSQDWIEANPNSGNGNQTIYVTVDRTGLDVGNYYGSVIVTSNGGNENVSIAMEQSLPTEGLVAYYPFNGNANDESGNENDGENHDATPTTDRFGNENRAYSFDGVNDYILVPDTDYLDITTEGTIMGWVNIPSTFTPPWQGVGLVNKMYHSTGMLSYDLMIGHSTPFAGGIGDGVNSFYVYSIYTTPDYLYNDTWHLLSFAWNNYELKLYINENLENYDTYTSNGAQISTWDLNIGRRAYSSSTNWKYFKGYIDDIRIYNRALTEAEIQALYYEGGWGE